MPRVARVAVAEVAYHVTQRGNGRQFILPSDAERWVYLDLVRQAVRRHALSVVGYCLMSNHVHLVVVPHRPEALAEVFHQVHGRYASYWNVAHASCGHVWQGRFHSCPMDPGHLWTALRYAELNPVRAALVEEAAAWPWSSAPAHCGVADADACLEMSLWREHWSVPNWRKFLAEGERESELRALRRCTYKGLPFGPTEFTRTLETSTQRKLTVRPRGRPRKAPGSEISTVIERAA